MKKTSLRTVELRSCQADYLKEGPELKNRISDSQYCAADPNGIRDACQGIQDTVRHYNCRRKAYKQRKSNANL